MLSSPDYAIVAVYVVVMTWIGLVARRKASSSDEYFAAGHHLPWWMAAISHHVSGYSAVVFVGFAGRASSAGFSLWTLFSLSCFIAMMIAALAWAPRWSRLRVLTPVEYLEARYGNSVRLLVSLAGIGVKFVDLGIKLYAISIVVQVCTGWSLLPIIAVGGLVTVLYVLVGGLWATVLTDVIQFGIQLVLSLLVLVVVLSHVGGWTSMWDQLPPERAGLFNAGAGISFEFWLVLLVVTILSYSGGTWGLAQRFISVAEPRDTQKAAVLSGFLYLLYPLVIFIPAWAAPLMMPEVFDPATLLPREGYDPDQTYVLLARQVLTDLAPGLIGLLICSMFAATMSMIDSDLNSLAAVFTNDVYRRNFDREAGDSTIMRVGRIATVVFGAAVLITAVWISQSEGMGKVFEKTIKLFSAVLPPVAIPLMFGLIWKRTTARGAVLCLIGGLSTYALLYSIDPDNFTVNVGAELAVTLAIYFGEGYLSRRSADKEREVDALFERLRGRGGASA